ncbi:uncharacterized protein K02A2.6-like [Pectinophora gossypiella]|uniref:uncharacterized protein K02A2.6-like n=1 Tax=Pectinophora gossypiella TaxID=13191 RepID=UPI00214F26DA|nr:uncharacterized protein K02A2.6-like [Pectinophora gossypiella]
MAASRMQRWAIILSAYDYKVEYVKTTDNSADGLSRLPARSCPVNKDCERSLPEQTFLHFAQDALLLNNIEIRKQTSKDIILGRVLSYIRDGWPDSCEVTGLQPFYNRRSELYEELGCVMWGHRVVIPGSCRDSVLWTIHEPHMGIVKSKALARSYVWWPGVDEAVEATCRACSTCAAHSDSPPHQAPRSWPWPARPWSRIHIDFLGPIFGKTYLVIVDATSKWIEIFHVPSTASRTTISKLRELWSRFGIPKQVVSDNGPPFSGQDFGLFLREGGVEHLPTAPYHPSSNGAAENAVRTLKRVIKKAVTEGKDTELALNTFLLYYRNTEHLTTGETPSMLLMGRRLRTHLDALKPDRDTKVIKSQKCQIDNAGGTDRVIRPGDEVWYRQFLKAEKWAPGVVVKANGTTDFQVIGEQGIQQHRHADQLKRRSQGSFVVPMDPKHGRQSQVNTNVSEVCIQSELAAVDSSPGHTSGVDSPARRQSRSTTPTTPTTETHPPAVPPRPEQRPIRQCRIRKIPNYKC